MANGRLAALQKNLARGGGLRSTAVMLVLFAWFAAGSIAAQTAASAPPDYRQPALWLCRPGQEARCADGLDATVLGANGAASRRAYPPADDAAQIDCFYVYPTASEEKTDFADLKATSGILRSARTQAGRLAAHCRLFAPIYRQRTLAGLAIALREGTHGPRSTTPYDDILAAWRSYMANDNHGRGVVLIGHSQGTVMLQRLIAEEIDGRPAQDRIVSIFLAGDPSLTVPRGRLVGGTFQHLPLCQSAAQTGCVYVWSTYAADDATPIRKFGRDRAGLVGACNNPAAPGGGTAMLKAILPRGRAAQRDNPEWVAADGQISGRCETDAQGSAFRIRIADSPSAGDIRTILGQARSQPGWGLHRFDISLVQGNVIDVIDQETRTWTQALRAGAR